MSFVSNNSYPETHYRKSKFFIKFMWCLSIKTTHKKRYFWFFFLCMFECFLKDFFTKSLSPVSFMYDKIIDISDFFSKDFPSGYGNYGFCFSFGNNKYFFGRYYSQYSSQNPFIYRVCFEPWEEFSSSSVKRIFYVKHNKIIKYIHAHAKKLWHFFYSRTTSIINYFISYRQKFVSDSIRKRKVFLFFCGISRL